MARPRKVSSGMIQQEKERIDDQVTDFQQKNLESTSMDAVAAAPIKETAAQTQISAKQIEKTDAPWIKPSRSYSPGKGEKRIPQLEAEIARGKEYIKCIAENAECLGARLEFWLKKYPGEPCHFWEIPVNRPVYLPRYVAEHISTRWYSRIKMSEGAIYDVGSADGGLLNHMQVTERVRRLDCRPVAEGFGA